MRFESPFWLLALIPLMGLIFHQYKKTVIPTIQFPDVASLFKLQHKYTKWVAKITQILRYIILFLIVLTLARPQAVNIERNVVTEGIDIMMVLDTSRSMSAEDLQPDNRLTVAKETMKSFISKRTSDRIGLVVFGSDAFTQCPLTSDYQILSNLFNDIDFAMAGDGTAIGMALATGLNRLKESPAKSKLMILLTDGENNMGEVSPERAAELARDLGVKIYTIGVGQEGGAPVPFFHPVYGKVYSDQLTYLDEETLKSIAQTTQGEYFRATDSNSLKDIYNKIDLLEKTDIKSTKYIQYDDFFPSLLMWITCLLLIELLLFNLLLVVSP